MKTLFVVPVLLTNYTFKSLQETYKTWLVCGLSGAKDKIYENADK